MAKNAVYSWRITPERKAELEDVARTRKRPLAELVDEAVVQWLRRQHSGQGDDEARLLAAATRAFGRIAGGDRDRASLARERLRKRLLERQRG
jgi:hypothetical protein